MCSGPHVHRLKLILPAAADLPLSARVCSGSTRTRGLVCAVHIYDRY